MTFLENLSNFTAELAKQMQDQPIAIIVTKQTYYSIADQVLAEVKYYMSSKDKQFPKNKFIVNTPLGPVKIINVEEII